MVMGPGHFFGGVPQEATKENKTQLISAHNIPQGVFGLGLNLNTGRLSADCLFFNHNAFS